VNSVQRETGALVEHLFRHNYGRIVAVLVRLCGVDHLDRIEDAVHEAMLKALQQWPFSGIPSNPGGWLFQVARNLMLDGFRRDATFQNVQADLAAELHAPGNGDNSPGTGEFSDDLLGMMFACCHPLLTTESQMALTLRSLCGFSESEIARAFLSSPDAVHKRLVRARQVLRSERVAFDIPTAAVIDARRETILSIIYLIFNEGYGSHEGEDVIRRDLCEEAIYLGEVLARHPAGDVPEVHALLALMYFHAARFPARVDDHGNILLLQDQDRSLWDAHLIQAGIHQLDRSAAGDDLTEFHLQAGIAALHCLAASFEATDWSQILSLYDQLVERNPSPVIALNRAVAIARVHGPGAAIREAERAGTTSRMQEYYLLHAVLGELHSQAGNFPLAQTHWTQAFMLTHSPSERRLFQKKLGQLKA
jgi:RNA polymerase sigma factor (sigma-70 family)